MIASNHIDEVEWYGDISVWRSSDLLYSSLLSSGWLTIVIQSLLAFGCLRGAQRLKLRLLLLLLPLAS